MTSLDSVVLAGGGTAGHVSPLLATAEEIRERHPQAQVVAVGSPGGIEERLVPQRGIPLEFVPKVAFPRRPGRAAVRFPLDFKAALDSARKIIATHEPQVVVGFGGYVSTPMYVAARRAGVPIVIHEQNARPGLANRLGARWASHVATTFPGSGLSGSQVTGMPLRRELRELEPASLRAEAWEFFGLEAGVPTLLVTGGSLGALSLNKAFAGAADDLVAAGVQVLHITGRNKSVYRPTSEAGARYVVVEYCDRMDLAYAVADLVVTRSGAGMVSELSTLSLPAVYVPLPIGNGEQRLNAADVVEAGGALLVDDAEIGPAWVRSVVIPLVTDEARLAAMRDAARSRSHAEGVHALVDLVEDAAGKGLG